MLQNLRFNLRPVLDTAKLLSVKKPPAKRQQHDSVEDRNPEQTVQLPQKFEHDSN